MKKNLKPLDLTEDVTKYEAHTESKEISFNHCKHKQVKFENGSLRCTCGAGWMGERLDELYRLLRS